MDSLNIQLDVVTAQNTRLAQENEQLRTQLQRINDQQNKNATGNIETMLKALKIEDERDRSLENLEKLKKKYNNLYQLYAEKAKRCKAFEQTFQKQKTLTGLVTKSSLDQILSGRNKPVDISDCFGERESIETLSLKVQKLQKALNEAYDIIDELEFEMETIDFLEMENQRLQTEVHNLKGQTIIKPNRSHIKVNNNENTFMINECLNRDSMRSTICKECQEHHELYADDFGQSILTDSLNQAIEIEKNTLRRELLKSRLQNTLRSEILPKPSKEKLLKKQSTNA